MWFQGRKHQERNHGRDRRGSGQEKKSKGKGGRRKEEVERMSYCRASREGAIAFIERVVLLG